MAVVTLDEAKTFLNMGAGTTHNAELTLFIARAEAAIAERCGPLETTARTVRVPGRRTGLMIPGPAASLTTVVDDQGTAVTVGDLHLEERAGLVTYDDGTTFSSRWYDVTYQFGRVTCPPDLEYAVLALIKHMWQSQRGGARRPGSSGQSAELSSTILESTINWPSEVMRAIHAHRPQMVG